jgi:ABC-type lipoprotein export system ATPase subunit
MIKVANTIFQYPHTESQLVFPEIEIDKGQKVAITGESGCGKTTLLCLMAGIYAPIKGKIICNGASISTMSIKQRSQWRSANIGAIFQNFELVEYLKVRENIMLPFMLHSFLQLNKEVARETDMFIEKMGLVGLENRYPSQLSQGEKQRVAIARAFLPKPPIILADEPTGNLDPQNKQRILDLLLENVHQSNVSLVMVTHDHSLLPNFDQVIDLHRS